MRSLRMIPSAVVAISVAATIVAAQTKAPSMPRKSSDLSELNMPMFNSRTVTTVRGVVTAIDTVAAMGMGSGPGVHMTLRAKKRTWPVHLGPVPYLVTQPLRLMVGDTVSIEGSEVVMSTVPTLLARKIRRGKESLLLRDTQGFPLWRGMMMKMQAKPSP